MVMNYEDWEVTYEIVEEIGVIASQPTGWTKELNVVSWNGGQAKYDIREWSPHHDRMSKGITLNEQEMRTILDLLKRRGRFVPRGVNVPQGSTAQSAADQTAVPQTSAAQSTAQSAAQSAPPSAAAPSAAQDAATQAVPDPQDDAAWDDTVESEDARIAS